MLSEVFPAPKSEAAAIHFILTQLGGSTGPILWIQDRMSRRDAGRPHLPGLGNERPLLLLELSRPADVLIAAEEGLRCKALSAVVAEINGDPAALNFTATKRLAIRAEAAKVPCWIIRQGGRADLSAARDRWRISMLPSSANPDDTSAPGTPCWRVELFRTRDGRPGNWVARYERGTNGAADRFDLVAAVSDGALAEPASADGHRLAR